MGYQTIVSNGRSDNRIDIVVAGDGYDAGEQDLAVTHARALADYLFFGGLLSQPFGRYAKFFNLHVVQLVSAQSGADDPAADHYVDTALHASYRWDGMTQRLLYVDALTADQVVAAELAGSGIEAEIKFASVNSTQYGGGGGSWAVYAGGNDSSLEVALHEVGHSFAGLADEYGDSALPYSGAEPFEPNVSTDPSGGKWAHWLGYDQPGVGVIGAYEGGYYHQTGIYRPAPNSKMRSLGQPFDAVSREAFVHAFYAVVDPIDASTSARAPANTALYQIRVIDPAIIKVQWRLDGTVVGSGGQLNLAAMVEAPGTYRLRGLAYDPVAWVRDDRSDLKEMRTWTVQVEAQGATGGDDLLVGTRRSDLMLGLDGRDKLNGGAGHDGLRGGAGNDRLLGSAGGDLLVGDSGADLLDGGAGRDVLTGGEGRDRFVFAAPAHGRDRITDFDANDRIMLRASGFSGVTAANLETVFTANAGGLATESHHRLVFATRDGRLFYDANGAASGGRSLIATLNERSLSAAQFVVA